MCPAAEVRLDVTMDALARVRAGRLAGLAACVEAARVPASLAGARTRSAGSRGRFTIVALLYGRDAERFRIGALLDGARESRSGVLVIRGEAGVGKSALLEDARERASGMQVLSGGGIESEAQLPFAALHQFVRPIVGYVETLPEPQAGALRAALGLEAFMEPTWLQPAAVGGKSTGP